MNSICAILELSDLRWPRLTILVYPPFLSEKRGATSLNNFSVAPTDKVFLIRRKLCGFLTFALVIIFSTSGLRAFALADVVLILP